MYFILCYVYVFRLVSWMIWHMLKACLGGPFGTWLHMVEVHILVILIHA
jgi:hypothetical protein